MFVNRKYVWCRPYGGFNDNLCQIAKCLEYCKKYNRTLVIDTLWGVQFNWQIGLVLNFADSNVLVLDSFLLEHFKKITCFPKKAQELNFAYTYHKGLRMNIHTPVCIAETDIVISFNFEIDYEENLLIHQQDGSPEMESLQIIDKFQLTPDLASKVKQLRQIYNKYTAIHIRNTDLFSDYRQFLINVANKARNKNILICSDNPEVKDYALTILKDRLFSVVDIPLRTTSKYFSLATDRRYTSDFVVKSTLLDLCMLAYSDELFMCPVIGVYGFYFKHERHSGYSKLAQYLHQNRNVVNCFAAQM